MTNEGKKPLKVFLCHASGDKPPVRDLYKRLTGEGVDAWLDQEKLLPGQDWRLEIPRAVHEADVVVVCLSNKSLTKEGYVQKEIKFALDIAEEKPDGTIFLIPARLEDCPVPDRLSRWQWVDLYDENGFTRLLRSLKLRASAVGAVIEPTSEGDSDKEIARRIEQLYTEGLAAFYTEDWDKACRRFQSILSEQPNHRSAAEKLEEADDQRQYAKLYSRATEAYQTENWPVAIDALEELGKKSANYKDAAQLLRDARKREQLRELYSEAKALHAAQQWQAVVKVFEQINVLEPNYPDPNGLLASAQEEVTELKRLAQLNDLYDHALHRMDAGDWYEARRLLESVHKSQTGFLKTEKLLRKVENEILEEEEKRRRNEQIDVLYEQAHGLLRSRKWRNALEKLEEIKKLDEHFPDPDAIAKQVQMELEHDEQDAERQNKLAALYAESIRLIKEERYQEALEKFQEVKAVDPHYPDRQSIQRTAKRKLAEAARPLQSRTRVGTPTLLWVGGSIALVVLISILTVFLFRNYVERTLFFDDFNEPPLNDVYVDRADLGHQGTPDFEFGQNDQFTVLKLRNMLGDHQSVGWQTGSVFDSEQRPVRLEIRFNTLIQSSTTSIDGFLDVGLIDGGNHSYSSVNFFAGDYGENNSFEGYELQDNTWYRLTITGAKGSEIKAALYDDASGEVLREQNLGRNDDLFLHGIKIVFGQSMGEPHGRYPVAVDIDWIRLSINPPS